VDDAVPVFERGYLVPGLVDAHAHLSLASPAGADAPPPERVRASARAQLDAGDTWACRASRRARPPISSGTATIPAKTSRNSADPRSSCWAADASADRGGADHGRVVQ
jgi:cytosine/adenosine deaminase-related metal-dependent hydrolase